MRILLFAVIQTVGKSIATKNTNREAKLPTPKSGIEEHKARAFDPLRGIGVKLNHFSSADLNLDLDLDFDLDVDLGVDHPAWHEL